MAIDEKRKLKIDGDVATFVVAQFGEKPDVVTVSARAATPKNGYSVNRLHRLP